MVYVSSDNPDYPFLHKNVNIQAVYQITSFCVTLLISICSGILTGWIMLIFPFPSSEFTDKDNTFNVLYDEYSSHPYKDTIRCSHFNIKNRYIHGVFDDDDDDDDISLKS